MFPAAFCLLPFFCFMWNCHLQREKRLPVTPPAGRDQQRQKLSGKFLTLFLPCMFRHGIFI
jgi:hypothetical protein